MADYTIESLSQIADEFVNGQKSLEGITVCIEPQENEVAPLILLRAYNEERTLDAGLKLATAFVVDKRVGFVKDGKLLLEFTPKAGQAIDSYFMKAPYLIDILVSTAWALLLKKLTPPSSDSANVGTASTGA